MLSLLKNLDENNIILASESPRRFELLNMIGLKFKVRPSHIEEKNKNNLKPVEYAIYNAKAKGEFVSAKYPESIVISADTIVVLGEKIIEKPENENHAIEILKLLRGKAHVVITAFGIILRKKYKFMYDYEKTNVKFRNLSSAEIKAYIESGEPFDKAGGYGAQGAGSLLIEKVDGCFYNVVGFPLSKFFVKFDQFLGEI
jgi:septum formation protein